MFRGFAAVAAIASVTTFALVSQAALSVISDTDIVVKASAKSTIGGPAVDFSGTTSSLKVSDDGSKLTFVSDLNKLDLGLRKSHFVKNFEVEKHGEIKLVIDKSKLKMPEKDAVDGSVQGQLTLHGVTKSVTVKYGAKREGSDILLGKGYGLSKPLTFEFKYKDFGVKEIKEMSLFVQDPVVVTINKLKLRDK
jgi:polyisoprenoid-binding protein YceI